jgi:YD repeat-containing protein
MGLFQQLLASITVRANRLHLFSAACGTPNQDPQITGTGHCPGSGFAAWLCGLALLADTVYTPWGCTSSVTVTPPGGTARITTYTYDNAGNRTGEQVKDPSGNLQRNITRVYDALNRIQKITGASN